MTSWIYSLQTKMTVAFIILILVIAGMTFVYTYNETKVALKGSMGEELKSVSGVMATQVNGDNLTTLKAGDETSSQYQDIVNQLIHMRSLNDHIKNAYIMKVENGVISFLVDDIYFEQPDNYAQIGEVYDSPDAEIIYQTVSGPTASEEFYSDRWGTFLSGYAPISDSNNNVVAILGVDMNAADVLAKQEFIGNTIYFMIILALVVAGGIILYFSRTIIKDIKKLIDVAERISMGETNVSVDIKRKDEIGELAASFSRMVASLKVLMDPLQQKR